MDIKLRLKIYHLEYLKLYAKNDDDLNQLSALKIFSGDIGIQWCGKMCESHIKERFASKI